MEFVPFFCIRNFTDKESGAPEQLTWKDFESGHCLDAAGERRHIVGHEDIYGERPGSEAGRGAGCERAGGGGANPAAGWADLYRAAGAAARTDPVIAGLSRAHEGSGDETALANGNALVGQTNRRGMKPYADTNFLARLYLELAETDEAMKVMGPRDTRSGMVLPVMWLHRMELTNAFQLYVFLSRQGRARVTGEVAQAAHASFQSDLKQAGFLAPASLTLSELEPQFEELSLRHTTKHGFRAYDLMHVASALLLRCDTFWTFDVRASRLASLEGLQVLKPAAI